MRLFGFILAGILSTAGLTGCLHLSAKGDGKHEAPKGWVAPSAEAAQPLGEGDPMPKVAVRKANGRKVNLTDHLEGGRSVIVFYRGGWCPYCTQHLAELAGLQQDLAARGVRMVGISPDQPGRLHEAEKERELPYELLSDSSFEAATAFGVAFLVDDPTNEALLDYGVDLAQWSGNREDRILPVPAVFLVDEAGLIRFAHTNPDYSIRLSGEELLLAIDDMASGG